MKDVDSTEDWSQVSHEGCPVCNPANKLIAPALQLWCHQIDWLWNVQSEPSESRVLGLSRL